MNKASIMLSQLSWCVFIGLKSYLGGSRGFGSIGYPESPGFLRQSCPNAGLEQLPRGLQRLHYFIEILAFQMLRVSERIKRTSSLYYYLEAKRY